MPEWIEQPNASVSMKSGLREVVQQARSAVQQIFDLCGARYLVRESAACTERQRMEVGSGLFGTIV